MAALGTGGDHWMGLVRGDTAYHPAPSVELPGGRAPLSSCILLPIQKVADSLAWVQKNVEEAQLGLDEE